MIIDECKFTPFHPLHQIFHFKTLVAPIWGLTWTPVEKITLTLQRWKSLGDYADSTCAGIITSTRETHPDLGERELRFLSLCCCNLPTTVVMACMGYNDPHSLYNKKRRLAEKLGPYEKLEDYIIQFMELD